MIIPFANFDNIKLVEQTCNRSCYAACLAMVFDIPIEDVIKELGHEPPYTDLEVVPFIVRRKVYPDKVGGVLMRAFTPMSTMIVIVPSKNIIGGTHAIIIATDEDGEFKLLDPSINKKYTDTEWINGDVIICEVFHLHNCRLG